MKRIAHLRSAHAMLIRLQPNTCQTLTLFKNCGAGFSSRNTTIVNICLPHNLHCILQFDELITRQQSSGVLTWFTRVCRRVKNTVEQQKMNSISLYCVTCHAVFLSSQQCGALIFVGYLHRPAAASVIESYILKCVFVKVIQTHVTTLVLRLSRKRTWMMTSMTVKMHIICNALTPAHVIDLDIC